MIEAKDTVPPHSQRPLRVLVVDDLEVVALMLSVIVKRLGHQVHMAHDAETALDIAQHFLPDVVFLDIGLPRKNGYELCQALRSGSACATALIIAVTGRDEPEDLERSLLAGFDRHIVKPMDLGTLHGILAMADLRRTG